MLPQAEQQVGAGQHQAGLQHLKLRISAMISTRENTGSMIPTMLHAIWVSLKGYNSWVP